MIPSCAHFVWFGPHLPYAYVLGVRSAALRGGFDEVLIHHADELAPSVELTNALALPGVGLKPLNEGTLESAPIERSGALVDLFRKLEQPAAKANMMRAAILATRGGVYLDTDTLLLKDFDSLRANHTVFCGAEHIALPSTVKDSRNPFVSARAGAMMLYRDVFRRQVRGWHHFRRVEHFYPAVANNSILASEAAHPFMIDLLNGMLDLPSQQQLIRFALGTKLLQQCVTRNPEGCSVLPPELFFPIGPEVSQHWFREDTALELEQMLHKHTRLIHWYQ